MLDEYCQFLEIPTTPMGLLLVYYMPVIYPIIIMFGRGGGFAAPPPSLRLPVTNSRRFQACMNIAYLPNVPLTQPQDPFCRKYMQNIFCYLLQAQNIKIK